MATTVALGEKKRVLVKEKKKEKGCKKKSHFTDRKQHTIPCFTRLKTAHKKGKNHSAIVMVEAGLHVSQRLYKYTDKVLADQL